MEQQQGMRVGDYVLLIGEDGSRYAVRPRAIVLVHDEDPTADATIVHLPGNRLVRLPFALDEVLAWFHPTTPTPAPAKRS